jgi:hypothetical protein
MKPIRHYLVPALCLVPLLIAPARSQWNITTVDNSGDVGLFSDIAYDSQGYPHIVYYRSNSPYAVMYARYTGEGGWLIEEIYSNSYYSYTGYGCSISLDPTDTPHVSSIVQTGSSYFRLYYFTKDQGSWTQATVKTDVDPSKTSIAVTYDDMWQKYVPHIIFKDDGHLYYAYRNPETDAWISQLVDGSQNVGNWTDMVVDASGRIYVSYYDAADKDLRFAYFNGTTWGTFIVDGLTTDVGSTNSITLDQSGTPHITYYDETYMDLKHATINLAGLLRGANAVAPR